MTTKKLIFSWSCRKYPPCCRLSFAVFKLLCVQILLNFTEKCISIFDLFHNLIFGDHKEIIIITVLTNIEQNRNNRRHIGIKNTSLDILAFYDGQVNGRYCAIFDPVAIDVFKAYYAFEFFGRLYRAKHQIETDEHQSIVAAADEESVYALIANPGDEDEVCKIVVKNTTASVMKTEIVSDTETCAERYEKLSGGEAVITVPKHGTVFVTLDLN